MGRAVEQRGRGDIDIPYTDKQGYWCNCINMWFYLLERQPESTYLPSMEVEKKKDVPEVLDPDSQYFK